MRVGLVACGKAKVPEARPARDLYVGTFFRMVRAYVEATCARWFILSAKHGLLDPDRVIEPYDETLLRKSRVERFMWSQGVARDIKARTSDGDVLVLMAGAAYRGIVPLLKSSRTILTPGPTGARGIGYQMAWLRKQIDGGAA